MQYQSFRGVDIKEALSAVKATLGPNALIDSTRQIKNGKAGGLEQSYVEVTAAPPPGLKWPYAGESASTADAPLRRRDKPRTSVAPIASAPARERDPRDTRDTAALAREVDTLRAMLNEIYASRPPRERGVALLHAAGIEGELARKLCSTLGRGKKPSSDTVRAQLTACLKELITVRTGVIAQREPTLIACVGASGVGKTTSLAKLAAHARLDLQRSVGVISLDTYRVGAAEQWQRYASLLGVPFHLAATEAQFADALDDCKTDVVLVDTAGRSAQGKWVLPECLAQVTGRKIHVFLVLPAWTRAKDAERLLELYGDPKPTEIVITKMDEASVIGGVLHAALPTHTPLAYLCNGPRVPEDIQDAAVESVLEAVFSSTREVSL